MRRLAWCTDLHLNFISRDSVSRQALLRYLTGQKLDAILITGDSSEYNTLIEHLRELYEDVKIPIYYVLGNHDYYNGSIDECQQLCKINSNNGLNYLPSVDFAVLNHETCLVGVDNWYDTTLGGTGHLQMNDWYTIKEFMALPFQKDIDAFSKALAFKANRILIKKLENTVETNPDVKRIIIAIHVPPFRQNSLYNDKVSDFRFIPYFCSPSTGRVLKKFAKSYPQINFEVYCGHTHHKADYQALPNLKSRTGFAMYGYPQIEDIIEI